MLSLPKDDTTSLNEAASKEDELGNMTLKLIKLSHNQEHQITDEGGARSRVRLPKISIPTFNGKVLSWKSLGEQFDATIHSKAERHGQTDVLARRSQGWFC